MHHTLEDIATHVYPTLLTSDPKLIVDDIGFRVELPEKNTFIHFSDGEDDEDDGGAMVPTKTCPASVGSKAYRISPQKSKFSYKGFQNELPELPETEPSTHFDDGEESPASSSSNPIFSWARTLDTFDIIDDVQEHVSPMTPMKIHLGSVLSKEFPFSSSKPSIDRRGFPSELPQKNTFVHFDDMDEDGGPMIPMKTCPGSMESKEFAMKRNLQREAEHLRGECKPCAFFALREDGCRRGNLCEFCHLCSKKEIKRRKRQFRKNLK